MPFECNSIRPVFISGWTGLPELKGAHRSAIEEGDRKMKEQNQALTQPPFAFGFGGW